jgi:5S rRNA maturation endonuclease (ribonuclease M5)
MVNIDLQSLAFALGGEVSNNQVLCPGPGHSAKDRSLSVKLDADAPDGFIVNSFASDDAIECKDYVRAKLSLPAFKPNGGGGRRHRASTADISNMLAAAIELIDESEPAGRVVAAYDYTDDKGELLYQVLRYEPKGFSQRRPNGNGGWIQNIDGVGRVLYRLPELPKYPDACVFVCEGEKDADRVASLNLCATAVACGKWTNECVQALTGRDVLILEDADKAGREKALKAARALHGTAATIRVMKLPGLTGHPNNKDVSDWLDADPSRGNKLADVCFEAPLWTPSDEKVADDAPSKPAEVPRQRLVATPFVWRDPAIIPPRRWIYGWHYIRKFTSATIAPGALGKTSLDMVEAVAIALKMPLLGIMPTERCNVWYWNGEDPGEETERRIAAICARYDINGKDLEGRLFTDTGRLTPIKLAALKKGEIMFDKNLVRDIKDTIRENKIGVAIFDPFISVHDVPESDNTNIDAVVKCLGHVADETDISIELAHHVRKGSSGQTETTIDDARGASALMFAVRSGRVLNRMNKEQAAELKIEQPRFYFRSDNGKANLRPPEVASWWRLTNVDLPNGDQVGVVEAWDYPDPMSRITPDHMRKVRDMAAVGQYRKDPRSDDWIGRAVAEVADLDPDDMADLKTIKTALRAWFANGVLTTEERKDESRKTRTYVVPGTWNEEQ